MTTIADLHLPDEKKLCVVLADASAVEIFCDVPQLPEEIAFGLRERCDVKPLNEEEQIYCVSGIDDDAIRFVFDVVKGMFMGIHKHARLAEPPVYVIKPDEESGGLHAFMTISMLGRKPKTYEVVAPDVAALNHACIAVRWARGSEEVEYYGPAKTSHATQQALDALWDKVATASVDVLSKLAVAPQTSH